MALRSMLGLSEPHLVTMDPVRVAVVTTTGDPVKTAEDAVAPLYASVRALAELRGFSLKPLRARWPVDANLPRADWMVSWALPVPDDTDSLPQPDTGEVVSLDTWEYGEVAEILHEGSRSAEPATVDRLLEFIGTHGLEVWGPHEVEYLAPPDATVPKTLIRFQVHPPAG